jgi:peptidoglycan biosynthesis protein MviN/MurJ (putative lipid II flippase)
MRQHLLLAIEKGWNYVLDNGDTWVEHLMFTLSTICFMWLLIGIIGASIIVAILMRKSFDEITETLIPYHLQPVHK